MEQTNIFFNFFGLFDLDHQIQILDTGASAIMEVPFYKRLMELGCGHLNAIEGDSRQIAAIFDAYEPHVTVLEHFIFDGSLQNVYLAAPESGMSSLFKPKQKALEFFNGFEDFGKVYATEPVQTSRIDDIAELPKIDLVKMDIQGAELTALQNGEKKLKNCLVAQLEVSFIQLYEQQPSFGEVDVYMRSLGFEPHAFLEVKKWSIKPTIFSGNFRVGGNQLLEADIVYVKKLLDLDQLSLTELKKLAIIAHHSLKSIDLCGRCLIELIKRGAVSANSYNIYLTQFQNQF